MTKQLLTTALLSIGVVFALATSAQADIIADVSSYDSPSGYDFVSTFPPSGSTTIGTFTDFSIPAGDEVTGVTVSGTFGNGDSGTTALSDDYIGFGGNETAITVANCDDISDDCYSAQEGPTSWTYSLTASDLTTIAPALAAGSVDLTYTWDNNTGFAFPGYDQYVYAGATTLDIQVAPTPEPATLLICLSGLAGIAAFRRFRKI